MAANWTPAVLNKMKSLLSKGLSTAEIGKKIGMSKNAVVGKLNRLGWNAKSQEKPAKKKPVKVTLTAKADTKKAALKKSAGVSEQKKSVSKKTVPAKSITEKKSTAVATHDKKSKSSSKDLAMHKQIIQHSLEMVALKSDQCRWPIGDPDTEDFHFCGEKVFVGKPYCYEHCRAAYQFQAPKKKHNA